MPLLDGRANRGGRVGGSPDGRAKREAGGGAVERQRDGAERGASGPRQRSAPRETGTDQPRRKTGARSRTSVPEKREERRRAVTAVRAGRGAGGGRPRGRRPVPLIRGGRGPSLSLSCGGAGRRGHAIGRMIGEGVSARRASSRWQDRGDRDKVRDELSKQQSRRYSLSRRNRKESIDGVSGGFRRPRSLFRAARILTASHSEANQRRLHERRTIGTGDPDSKIYRKTTSRIIQYTSQILKLLRYIL